MSCGNIHIILLLIFSIWEAVLGKLGKSGKIKGSSSVELIFVGMIALVVLMKIKWKELKNGSQT